MEDINHVDIVGKIRMKLQILPTITERNSSYSTDTGSVLNAVMFVSLETSF